MKLKHENLIKLKEVVLIKGTLYLIFQYMENNIYLHYKNLKESNLKVPVNIIKAIVY